MSVAVATPPGYEPSHDVAHNARGLAEGTGARVRFTNEPAEALQDADAVYTDVWASMGQESQKAERLKDFAPYQVDEG